MNRSDDRSWTSGGLGPMIPTAVPLLPRARPESGLIFRRSGALSSKGRRRIGDGAVVAIRDDHRPAATLATGRWTAGSASSWDPIQRECRAADLAAAEASDRALELHGGRPSLDRDDRCVGTVQVLRADGEVDAHDIPDT